MLVHGRIVHSRGVHSALALVKRRRAPQVGLDSRRLTLIHSLLRVHRRGQRCVRLDHALTQRDPVPGTHGLSQLRFLLVRVEVDHVPCLTVLIQDI